MSNQKSVSDSFSHERYEWLDQARGIIVMFLVVASVAWSLASGDKRLEPALSPTFLNHGFIVADVDPPVITMLDNGAHLGAVILAYSQKIQILLVDCGRFQRLRDYLKWPFLGLCLRGKHYAGVCNYCLNKKSECEYYG